MPRKKIIAAAIVGTVAAAAAGGAWWFKSPIQAIKRQVKRHLNDPDSARFGDVVYSQRTGHGCGYVNAKNRMGGYVGETAFMAKPDGSVIFEPDGNTETGPAADRLAALNAKIQFLELSGDLCSETPPSTKKAP